MAYLGLAILTAILGIIPLDHYLTGYSFLRRRVKTVLALTALTVGLGLVYKTHLQFRLWQEAGPPSSYLIPPYRGIGYFLFYTGTRFWAPYLISGLAGFLVLRLAGYLNKKYGERFFRPEEPYFIALSIFLNGHPGWIAYIFLVLLTALIFAVGHWLFVREIRPLSFYYLWLPAGIANIILSEFWTRHLDLWQGLVI